MTGGCEASVWLGSEWWRSGPDVAAAEGSDPGWGDPFCNSERSGSVDILIRDNSEIGIWKPGEGTEISLYISPPLSLAK